MSSHTVRIAMLNAEVPVPPVLSQRGSFGAIFHDIFRRVGSRISPKADIISTEYDVRQGQYPQDLSSIDAILITGSAASAYDDEEWIHQLVNFICAVYLNHPRVKLFGSCFGHQVICQSLLRDYGVVVEKDPKGYENGVREVTLTEKFREAFKENASFLPPETMRLQFVHGDHVLLTCPNNLPSSWTNVGSTQHCMVQGVYQPGRVLTLQGHLEFDRFVNAETLKHFASTLAWDPDKLQEYLELVDADDDSIRAAEMVVKFFLEQQVIPTVTGLLTPPLESP